MAKTTKTTTKKKSASKKKSAPKVITCPKCFSTKFQETRNGLRCLNCKCEF